MSGCLLLMPILFCGGSEKQIRLIAEEIEKNKLPLTVIVESGDDRLAEEEKKYIYEHPGIRYVMLNTPAVDAKYEGTLKKYWAKGLSILKLMNVISKEIKKSNISIAMVTNLTGLVLQPWLKIHGCELIYNERNPGEKVCNSIWKRYLLNHCKNVVCNSKYASVYMSRKLNRPVEVINNGICPLNFFNVPSADNVFRIIVPARVSSVKNQKVLIKAINLVKNNISIYATFAGVIEDENYYEQLMNYIEKNKLNEYVDFIGFTTEIYKYYRSSDLLVLPSLEEGTPNVLLEAFMCKMKVLASDIPMNRDCVRDNEYLFEPENAEQLAEKIIWISKLGNEELHNKLESNYDYVVRNYGLESMGKRYIELLYN